MDAAALLRIWLLALCIGGLLATRVAAQTRSDSPTAKSLRIVHLDVGQGDAALVTTPEGRHILIDGGPDANDVAYLLRDFAVDTIDLVVASHNHADHIGGLPAVFAAFAVRAYLENGVPHTTNVYRRLIERVESEPGIRVLAPTARVITVGSVRFHILPPSRIDGSQNNNSVGILIEYGHFRALLTGDSERPELDHWVAEERATAVAVLKAAHHGSRNGTTKAWMRATDPAVVVISVGKHNRYNHPSRETERLWGTTEARIYRTDRDGAIEITAEINGRYAVRTHATRGFLPE